MQIMWIKIHEDLKTAATATQLGVSKHTLQKNISIFYDLFQISHDHSLSLPREEKCPNIDVRYAPSYSFTFPGVG